MYIRLEHSAVWVGSFAMTGMLFLDTVPLNPPKKPPAPNWQRNSNLKSAHKSPSQSGNRCSEGSRDRAWEPNWLLEDQGQNKHTSSRNRALPAKRPIHFRLKKYPYPNSASDVVETTYPNSISVDVETLDP